MNLKKAISISDEQTNKILKSEFEKRNIILYERNAAETPSLTAFVTDERDIQSMSYIIIDLRFLNFSYQHILSAVQMVKRFCNAKLIFIAEKSAETEILFGKLASFNVKDLIAAEQNTDVISEIIKRTENERKFHETTQIMQNAAIQEARKIASPNLTIPKNAALTIAVMGAMKRIGTTTQTLGIYNYLKNVGFMPIIVDKTQKMIEFFAEIYSENVKEHENSIEINEVHFGADILIGTQFNAFIYELGTGENNEELFRNVHFPIIVGGAKEWEFKSVADELNKYVNLERLKLILSFSTENIAEQIGKSVGLKTFAAPFAPDFWNSENAETNQFYRGIFYEDLKEYCRKCGC